MTETEKQERLLMCYADVEEAAGFIVQWLDGTTMDAFCGDILMISAVERQFEIIGEASKRIRDTLGEKHPQDSDWYGAMKMRDFIAHCYEHVNPKTLWNVAKADVPGIRKTAKECLDACEAALKK